jgi:hypothetical protein
MVSVLQTHGGDLRALVCCLNRSRELTEKHLR